MFVCLFVCELANKDVFFHLPWGSQTNKLLAQPLAEPVKKKLTREEAYGKKKEEITEKWETTVLENRKADHLKFPFAETPAPRLTTASLATIQEVVLRSLFSPRKESRFKAKQVFCGTFQPANALEQGIADILAQSGATKKDIDELDGLDPKELSTKEVYHMFNQPNLDSTVALKSPPSQIEERESQIQKMKAVLFYEEMKAKRRKKIKSKACVHC